MRRVASAILTVCALGTGAASLWALGQNPFAAPLVERTADEARVALERAMAREVTADWLLPRLDEALASGDRDRIGMLADLALTYGVAVPADRRAAVADALAPPPMSERAADCAACAVDIRSCPTLAQIGACAVPFELSVAGDVNALRRQATAAVLGEDVDEIEAGLAVAGVAATGLVIFSGGSSYTIKAGATVVRVARRMGALTPAFASVLADTARIGIDWQALLRGRPWTEITDMTRLARLGRMAEDFGTIRANTSAAEALVLFRHVDSAEDAARLARLSDAATTRTRATIEVLGKGRAFRALTRISDMAVLAIGLAAAFVAQVGTLLASVLVSALRRAVRPRRRLHPRPRHAMIAGQ